MNDDPDVILAEKRFREQHESMIKALEWQQQEAEALASACKYLMQAANNEVPHD
jgi:hypothetical protein